ncbi:MAG: glycogen-binding domain-containing protein [Vicinamibacterales bacterium]
MKDDLERAIDETRAFFDARPAPHLTAEVMRRVEQIGHPAPPSTHNLVARLVGRLWTTRDVTIRFRPAYGLLAAAAIAAVVLSAPAYWRTPGGSARAGAAEPQFFVQFRLEAATASTVRLAGSFTNWQPHYELHETAPGIWTITLPLSLGVHDYVFVVDGTHWVSDPLAQHVDDGFGGTNSRIALLAPDRPRS